MIFYILIIFIVIQRIAELVISNRNSKWLKENGAKEYGQSHYKFIVLLHVSFILSMIAEYSLKPVHFKFDVINYLFLVFFIVLQTFRISVIRSLGRYWNTRIFRIEGKELIKTGLYKYFRHPNYIIVVCEIFTVPMIFNLYYTAIIFSILNAVVLSVRIKEENRILKH